MTTRIIILSALTAIVTGLYCSCDEPDGLQDPLKWRTEVKFSTDANGQSYVSVPQEGGIYEFKCVNYDSFWITSIAQMENGSEKYYEPIINDGQFIEMSAPWACAKFSDKDSSLMTITVQPNADGKERHFKVNVQYCNAFDSFSFRQSADK